MRKRGLFFVGIFLIAIFSINLVSAVQINLNSQEFYPGETFIAHITGNFTKELKTGNILFIKDSSEISVPFYILKTSPYDYYVYVTIPRNTGNYELSLQNILYYDSGILKSDNVEKEFKINEAASLYYLDLEKKSLPNDVESLSLMTAALYNSNIGRYNAGKEMILGKSTNDGCWVSGSTCNIKSTSLALIALAKSNSVTEKMKNWLLDAENNLDLGLWQLSLDSTSFDTCNLTINTKNKIVNISSGNNKLSLDNDDLNDKDLADINIKCSINIQNPKIIHTYLGKVYEFPLSLNGNSASITLNNKKCFGIVYRGECDAESTTYALLAIKALSLEGKDSASWLEKNLNNNFERAVTYLFTKTSSLKSWLENNQENLGYWPSNSLSESTIADNKASIFASYALDNENGKTWAKNNLKNFNTNDLSLALIYLFVKPEAIISVTPVYFRTFANSNIYLIMENKGAVSSNISLDLEPFGDKKEIFLEKGKSQTINFFIPDKITGFLISKKIENETPGSLVINYIRDKTKINFYNLNLLIIPQTESGNFTIEKSQFLFYPQNISLTLLKEQELTLRIQLRDLSQYKINNISFKLSRDLFNIAKISPENIEYILPGTEKELSLLLNISKLKNYSGYIEANGDLASTSINITVFTTSNISNVNIGNYTINFPVSNVTNKTKTCADFNNGTYCRAGFVCKGKQFTIINETTKLTQLCCPAKCVRDYTKMIGVLIIILVIAILVLFFSLKLRKPKKDMKDVISDVEKKYSRPYMKPEA